MTKYTKAFFGVSEDTPFNLRAAVDTYEWVSKHPAEAPFVVSKMLFDNTTELMAKYADVFDSAANAYVAKRLGEAQKALSNRVSKSSQDALGVVETIAKAEYSEWERRSAAERQLRDVRGRFRVMNRKISQAAPNRPWKDEDAKALGIPKTKLSSGEKAKFQHDYQQVSDTLRQLNDATELGQLSDLLVQAQYSDGSTSNIMSFGDALSAAQNVNRADNGLVRESDYKAGKRVTRIEAVSTSTPATGAIMGFDALAAMNTSPEFADFAVGAGTALGGQAGEDFVSQWTMRGENDFRTNEQAWRRLQASSVLAQEMGGKYLPTNARLALKAGEWAGKYAPEAEKVIGPTARKSAYRYRGVEKKPDAVYQAEINNLRNKYQTGKQARDALIHGVEERVAINPRRPELGTRVADVVDSKTITRLKSKLPDPKLYNLNRKSGTIPPSQGIIIDRSGKVVTEAVGYGDDWYLPFNLKNLGRLKGGEYIRTRAYGGITTEDIYAGLIGGARAVTVVSHSGVYTMEFDDTYRGTRRYNEKSGRMYGRYGQLLDAVQSEDVTLGSIPADRMEELHMEAMDNGYDPDIDEAKYNNELKRLTVKERNNPKLSAQRIEQIKVEVLDSHVQDEGLAGSWAEFRQQQEAKAMADGTQANFRDKFGSTDDSLVALGLEQKATKAIVDAQANYAEDMNPLRLNGRGYAKALEALKDQFPYYIADVNYYPSTGSGGTDYGYVKPRYNRPAGALSGYYDKSITGEGKFSADQLKYQNYPVTQNRSVNFYTPAAQQAERAARSEQKEAGVEAGPKATAEILYEGNQRNEALLDVIKAMRDQNTWGMQADAVALRGNQISPQDREEFLNKDYGQIFVPSVNEIRAKLDEDKDGTYYEMLKGKVDSLRGIKAFDIEEGVWRNYESGGKARVVNKPENIKGILNGIGRVMFDYPGLQPGMSAEHYDNRLNKELEGQTLGLSADMDYAAASKVIDAEAERLRAMQGAWEARAAGKGAGLRPAKSPAQIMADADKLARISQAYSLRDMARSEESKLSVAMPSEIIASTPEEKAIIESNLRDGNFNDPAPEIMARVAPRQQKIRDMIGMDQVSKEIEGLIAKAVDDQRLEMLGANPDKSRTMHLVFTGNPGTGKTTIARELAPLYKELGLTENDKIKEYQRSDLVSEYKSGSAKKTSDAFDAGKGGVIFIDEAYALKNSPTDDYGQEAIDTLLTKIEENRENTVVILAGYPQEMDQFMSTNPGLRSRFPKTISFRNYNAGEMKQIANSMISERGLTLDGSADGQIDKAMANIAKNPSNGNARDVRNLVDNIVKAKQIRMKNVFQPTSSQLTTITAGDISNGIKESGLG